MTVPEGSIVTLDYRRQLSVRVFVDDKGNFNTVPSISIIIHYHMVNTSY